MLLNILSFLLLLVVLVFFGWLTTKAWRIKRLLLKIPAVLLSGLFTLVLIALTYVGGKGLAVAYIPPAPVPNLVVEGTPEQVARGEYIAKIACVGCHGANGSEEFPLSGGTNMSDEIPAFAGTIETANITPGGVLAERSDGELFNAIRFGFGQKERLGFMSFVAFRELSDEDTKSVIAYLRSQKPVKTISNGGDHVNLLGVMMFFGSGLAPLQENRFGEITAPLKSQPVEYGKYVATFGDCRGCHGPDMTGTETTALGPGNPNPRPFVSKLTQTEFIQTMRTGIRPNGIALQMPWKNAAQMSDDDLIALFTYLKSQP
jgi:mono/diheme cytochrome c family protein